MLKMILGKQSKVDEKRFVTTNYNYASADELRRIYEVPDVANLQVRPIPDIDATEYTWTWWEVTLND